MSDRMIEALESAKAKLREQDEFIKKIMTPPFILAPVADLRKADGTCLISIDGKLVEVFLPEKESEKVVPGATARLNPETMQIVSIMNKPPETGEVCMVSKAHPGGFCEIEHGNGTKLARCEMPVKEGDSVVIDPMGRAVLKNLGKSSRFSLPAEIPAVDWDDIGGLEEAKREMREAVELPYKHPEIFKHYNMKPPKGILLYGPPGCGKTMMGKAAVTAMAKMHGKKSASTGWIYVKGPEILDPYVGVAEANVRSLFNRARDHKKEHGYPAVIFLDEADALVSKRGSNHSSGIDQTLVPQFLAEMDGLDESSAIVMLTTNRPDKLDPAVVRDGRVDRKVRVGRPDYESALAIFQMYLAGRPLEDALRAGTLAKAACDKLFDVSIRMYQITRKGGVKVDVALKDFCSGAMIENIVDQASKVALRRDIARGRKGGVSTKDVLHAVDLCYTQNRDMDHGMDLEDFVREYSDDVVDVRKVTVG